MANESIGTAPCPLCGKPARVTVSKAGLCVLTCNRCHCQLFTRSDVSDSALRDRVTAPPKPEPEPAQPARLPEPEPPPAVPAPIIEPPDAPEPPPAAKPRDSWNI